MAERRVWFYRGVRNGRRKEACERETPQQDQIKRQPIIIKELKRVSSLTFYHFSFKLETLFLSLELLLFPSILSSLVFTGLLNLHEPREHPNTCTLYFFGYFYIPEQESRNVWWGYCSWMCACNSKRIFQIIQPLGIRTSAVTRSWIPRSFATNEMNFTAGLQERLPIVQ